MPLAALLLAGCAKDNKKREVEDKVRVQVNKQMESSELADAAEQLVNPATFMLAYKTAQMALEKDPANIKAQFYVKLLKRFEAFRGLGVRLKAATPAEQKKLNDFMARMPTSSLKDFLLSGKGGAVVNKATDVQDVLSQYFGAVSEFRDFLKKNETAEIEIRLNQMLFRNEIQKDASSNCVVVEDKSIPEGFVVECDYTNAAIKKLNAADLVVLRQITAGELLYSIANNYSLAGAEQIKEGLKPQEQLDALLVNQNFGVLRKNHLFGLIKGIGSDYGAAIKWARQNQSLLCPKGFESKEVQRKNYLVESGVCIKPQDQTGLDKVLATLDQALAGSVTASLRNEKTQEKQEVKIKVFALFDSPIQDLRQIAPTEWTACNKVAAIKDTTVNGYLIGGNANDFIPQTCN